MVDFELPCLIPGGYWCLLVLFDLWLRPRSSFRLCKCEAYSTDIQWQSSDHRNLMKSREMMQARDFVLLRAHYGQPIDRMSWSHSMDPMMLCDKNCVKSDHKTRVSSSKLVGTPSNSRKLDQQKYVCKTRQYTQQPLRNSQWGLAPSTVGPLGPRIGSPDYNWFKKSTVDQIGQMPLLEVNHYIYIHREREMTWE